MGEEEEAPEESAIAEPVTLSRDELREFVHQCVVDCIEELTVEAEDIEHVVDEPLEPEEHAEHEEPEELEEPSDTPPRPMHPWFRKPKKHD